MKNINYLLVVCLGILVATHNAQAVVKNAAQLQGNLLADGSADLNSATPESILWNLSSSIDPLAFEHSFDSGHQLKVLQDGDYLLLVTAPYATLPNAADNRPVQKIEVYVNGTPVPGTIGQSSYIRNQPRNANIQNESSDHSYSLIPGLSAGDVIEVKLNKHGTVGNISQISPAATLYAELVDDSRAVFAGLTAGTADGDDNLLRDFEGGEDPATLTWNAVRKDSGFTHSDGDEDISLQSGNYLVFVNIPLNGAVQRASVGGRILIDGQPVALSGFHQGYIRNDSTHVDSSIHYAGIIEISGNSTLSIETEKRAGLAGAVTIPSGSQGSIYIEQLGDGVFRSISFEVDADNPENFNPATKAPFVWESATVSDNAVYDHSSGSTEITVTEDGSYLLVYNDNVQSSVVRPNPKITVEVNGEEVRGAETKTHYIRSDNSHNHASAALAILLEDLKANDRVTVSTVAEGNQGDVIFDDFEIAVATVGLIKKEEADLGDVELAPRVIGFGGDANGWTINLQEFGDPLPDSAVSATENGEPAEVSVSRSDNITSIVREYPPISDPSYPTPGTSIDIIATFGNNTGSITILVPDTFVTLPAALAAGVEADTSKPGFIGQMSQINETQIGIDNRTFHNTQAELADLQISGLATDLSGFPYLNQIDPDWESETEWVPSPPFETNLVNFDQESDAGPGGDNFDDTTGHPNARFPGIGADNDPEFVAADPDTDGLAASFTTWLDLPQGVTTMGVNSDDLFKVTAGFIPDDQRVIVSTQNGGRGAADSVFDIVTYEAGVYPFRLLWWEGRGGASVEWFTVSDGEKNLINDPDNPNSIKAYSAGKGRPAVSSASPIGRSFVSVIDVQIETGIGLSDLKLLVDGAEVTATVTEENNQTLVSYAPDGGFAEGDHTYTLTFTDPSGPRSETFRFSQAGGVATVLEAGPFAYYRFAECEGDVARTMFGTALDATYVNGPQLDAERLVPADPSTSVRLDGDQSQYVQIPNHWRINDVGSGGPARLNNTWHEKSVELWFNADSLPRVDGALAATADANRMTALFEQGGGDRALAVYLYGTEDSDDPDEAELGFFAFNRLANDNIGSLWGAPENTATPLAYISTTVRKSETYHVVASFDGDFTPNADGLSGVMRLFVNGEQVGEVEGVGVLYNHTGDVRLGWADIRRHDNFSGASGYYSGRLDGVALYGRALTAAEATANYEAGLVEVPAGDCVTTPTPPVPPLPPIPGGGSGNISEIVRNADGTLSISFTGDLSGADTVTGPFQVIPGASSPHVVSPDSAAQFFLAR